MALLTSLETPEDMQWLREVHGVPPGYQLALVYGQLDCPDKVELLAANDIRLKPTVLEPRGRKRILTVVKLGDEPQLKT